MFGRVAVAHMHIPVAPAHADHAALLDAGKTQRHRVDRVAIVEWTLGHTFSQNTGIHPGAAIVIQRFRRPCFLHIQLQHPPHQPGSAGRDQLGPVFGLEPTGIADMVRMVMRDHHLFDRLAAQRTRHQVCPDAAGLVRGHPRIDPRPSVAVIQRIDVDVIQRHGQRQPHPQHALGDLNGLTRCRRLGPGITDRQRGFAVHQAASSSAVRA